MEEFEDYPKKLAEFNGRWATDEACRMHLEQLRWSDGFHCPRCEETKPWTTGRQGLRECANCHYQTSVTAGAIFEGTRQLRLWFLAMWLITSEKNGISAKGLQRELGCKRSRHLGAEG